MVELDKDAPGPAVRTRLVGGRRRRRPDPDRPPAEAAPRRRPADVGSDVAPYLLLLASIAPLAGALYQIIDLVGVEGLVTTRAVGPRLQVLGDAVNPLTGLLLVAAMVVALVVPATHVRLVAGTAVAVASLLLVVAVAVTVAAVRDSAIFPRTNDAHVQVISYEIGSALIALGVIWLALRVLRRPDVA